MRLLGVPLFATFLQLARGSSVPNALDCHGPEETDNVKECAQPIADVTAVVPGSSYIAKIKCIDCPFALPEQEKAEKADYLLLLNVTLTHDNRTVLLNNRPLYPLPTIPTPSRFDTALYATNLSNAELSRGLKSSSPYCTTPTHDFDSAEWCLKTPLWPQTRLEFDYLYIAESTQSQSDDEQDDAEYWNVSLDAIGRSRYPDDPLWKYDDSKQNMLWMLVKGTPLKTRKSHGGGGNKAADPFNGQSDSEDKRYEYQIVDMRLVARAYTFPENKPLSLWGRIGHFLGNDVWEVEGSRFLYRKEEWGRYGKSGTLRDMFGELVHWQFWDLFWIIFFSVVVGLLALFGLYKLFRWIRAQRELMKWDGMEDVWENMRRERIAEEEGALLHGEARYTDDPEEGGGSSRPPAYEEAMKPLPSKPLPEKPLPEVPLIET
ncbi:hypothetical protein COCCADRAFT_24238 [Bipolaris zeicola 26-R-13]|uniref:Autophagy-related protein 27 n=1 Tax=Cochliobolus carbonum (strain 26-R-13) TaxID=930089 RepID=W6YDT7_COCC2|nr:uncharacterized protein COCCADRAFT_24238 [Bipolaris zeicola 26-R-13]EUC35805.1 hypothetical protein COCCADRAFT_24238 [Bipolaris zeicola 26-R-13]